MPVLYFIRHGETDWNAARRLQGRTDTPLNETGRAQARRHGETLLLVEPGFAAFDFVASPLMRARETMEIIRSALGLPPGHYRIDPRLAEIHLGDFQGYSWVENRHRMAAEMDARDRDIWNARAPGEGGESYADLSARAQAWLSELTCDTVAVSHGGVQRCLRGHLTGLPTEQVPLLDAPQDRFLVWRGGDPGWL